MSKPTRFKKDVVYDLPIGEGKQDRGIGEEERQRRHILEAAAGQFAEHGYAATTVAQIAADARVGKEAFYRHFENREACYLALFDWVRGEATGRIAKARKAAPAGWPREITASLQALFDLARERPLALRACLGEALAVGPAAVDRYEQAQTEFGELLRPGRRLNPRGEELPQTLERTLAGGLFWMLAQRLEADAGASLDTLFPEALRFLLAPYLGDAEAASVADGEPSS